MWSIIIGKDILESQLIGGKDYYNILVLVSPLNLYHSLLLLLSKVVV